MKQEIIEIRYKKYMDDEEVADADYIFPCSICKNKEKFEGICERGCVDEGGRRGYPHIMFEPIKEVEERRKIETIRRRISGGGR